MGGEKRMKGEITGPLMQTVYFTHNDLRLLEKGIFFSP